jgi:acyl-CoA synthetase (AMP-forming)/AMP-acid ligase II/acyl carrier protein
MTASAELTVPDVLRLRAEQMPNRVALILDGVGELSYQEWDRRSDQLAHGLLAVGCAPGDRLLVLMDKHHWLDYAVVNLAIQKAGAVAVPTSAALTPTQIERIVAHCGARAVLCPTDLAAAGFSCPTWAPDTLANAAPAAPLPERLAAPADLAEIIYTSATTGEFKGVACSHRSLTFNPPNTQMPTAQPAADRYGELFLHFAPIGTNAAQGIIHNILRNGHMTAVTMPEFDAEQTCRLIAERRIIAVGLVPAIAAILVHSDAAQKHDLSSVTRVTLTGAATPTRLMEQVRALFPRADIVNGYGLTEAGTATLRMSWDPERPTAVGRPSASTLVRVTNDAGEPIDVDQAGELWLQAVGAPTRTYFRDPEATRRVFADGWIRTGDIGYVDAEGYVHLIDRKKDIIISGGVNISSIEIEDSLCTHPAVREAAVVGIPHPVLGEYPAAVIVADTPVDETELKAHTRRVLGEHKTPQTIIFMDTLPRNLGGKVRKDELARLLVDDQAQRMFVAAETPTQQALVDIWQRLLDVPKVGITDNFVELGGHSTLAVQMLSRLREELKVHIPLRAIFEAPTIKELSSVVERALERKTDAGWKKSGAMAGRPTPKDRAGRGESKS